VIGLAGVPVIEQAQRVALAPINVRARSITEHKGAQVPIGDDLLAELEGAMISRVRWATRPPGSSCAEAISRRIASKAPPNSPSSSAHGWDRSVSCRSMALRRCASSNSGAKMRWR